MGAGNWVDNNKIVKTILQAERRRHLQYLTRDGHYRMDVLNLQMKYWVVRIANETSYECQIM